MGMRWNNTRGLSVLLLGPCYQKAWLVGMQRWRRRACCCMSWWRAHWWSCVRRFVAASLRGGRAVLPEYSMWGLLKVGCISRHLLIARTVQVWPPVSQNISGVCIAKVSKMQANPSVDVSDADYGAFVSFQWLSFAHSLKHYQRNHIGDIDGGSNGQCEGCGGGTSIETQRGEGQGPGSSSTTVQLETAKGATMGKYLGLFCCQRGSVKPIPGQASSVSRRWGWTFLFLPFTQLRYEMNRQKISVLSVSHVLGHGRSERELHNELIPNCMEPCVGSWSLFTKSGRRPRSGQSWRCRSERQCETETFCWPTIMRPTRRGGWIGRKYSCISRHNCCKTSTPGHFSLSFRKEMFAHFSSPSLFLGHPDWIRAGYKGVGDVRPACLFPLVNSNCFLDSGVRGCCKVRHSCMIRAIDCSSVLHKMARTVSRIGEPGCDVFDISQLSYELDSMFQELDTPPSLRCFLITADVDQAFEACWTHISQSYESRISSKSILVRQCCRELCKLGRSQSFGRGWLSFSTPVLARALFSFTSVSLVMLGSMVWQIRSNTFPKQQQQRPRRRRRQQQQQQQQNNNNNNTNNNNNIWGGSVLAGEAPPPHSGELNHALSQAGGPTQSQLSRPVSSGHRISMEHRLRRNQLNSDTNASNKTYLKRNTRKKKRRNFLLQKKEFKKEKRKIFFQKKKNVKRKKGKEGPKKYPPRRLKKNIF